MAQVLDLDETIASIGVTVVERVARITALIGSATCPRCLGDLPTSTTWLPAGFHATECRCVPVCGICGTYESLTRLIDQRYWPLDAAPVREPHALTLRYPHPRDT